MSRELANFSAKTKMTIAYKCKNRCSNPECRIETVKIGQNGEVFSIGRACHIEAASKGGPRYNYNSTEEERRSMDNALWLCPVCADMIDKDVDAFPVCLLKQWKKDAEKIVEKDKVRIFAIANDAGGVGNSSVTAYLAQAFAAITNRKVLCVSVCAYDDVGEILFNSNVNSNLNEDDIITVPGTNIDYMSENAVQRLYYNQMVSFGKMTLDKLIEEKQYKYVFIDCGNGSQMEKYMLFHMATDVVLPIGDHMFTNAGIHSVRELLKNKEEAIIVWPLYSMGLTFSNKKYRRYWYKNIWQEINEISEMPFITVTVPSVIIPRSRYIGGGVLDIWKDSKVKHVAEAYLEFANEILDKTDK